MPNHHGTLPILNNQLRNVVHITNNVWAAIYRSVAKDSARNCLHPGIQSNVDGERQRLEPF